VQSVLFVQVPPPAIETAEPEDRNTDKPDRDLGGVSPQVMFVDQVQDKNQE
jgi:hypothetical protein